jgi:AraC-like DNA-binding protein/quercetin dioxygenase-like cupin family protein
MSRTVRSAGRGALALDCQWLSKTRHTLPDGPVVVRTFPVTFLHDVTQDRHDAAWHQLTFALRGHLEVITADTRRLVPADRAVWIPAGTPHTAVMRAPISMRSLFIAAAAHAGDPRVRTIAVMPLLRELIVHITKLGALDRTVAMQARLAGVLFDQLAAAEDVPLELPAPRDPRARRFAELVIRAPGGEVAIAKLARKAGASLRTLERCFLAETGLAVGEWRRRVRLFHAHDLIAGGASVTEAALEVGYSSVSAFSQAFARQFGTSPSKLRAPWSARPSR